MKKLSLVFACVGIISAASFGSGHPILSNPQEGTKVKTNTPKKIETAPQIEPISNVSIAPPTQPILRNEKAPRVKLTPTPVAPPPTNQIENVPQVIPQENQVQYRHPKFKQTARVKAKPMQKKAEEVKKSPLK